MCGSGKSEVVKLLVAKKFQRVYFGTATFEEMKKNNLPITEANERATRENLRKKYGMAAMAVLNLDLIKNKIKLGNVVVESLYSWEEYKLLAETFPNQVSIIAIHAPKEQRYQRLSTRPVRPYTREEVISRDFSQIENLHTGGPIAYADFLIVNDKTLTELSQEVDKIVSILEDK